MLIAVSAAHGRHALTRVWAKHTASLGFDMVIVSCTAGDAPNIWGCQDEGLPIVRMPNDPLSGKFNMALKHAMEQGATRIMVLPSDDFISPAWVHAARTHPGDYLIPHTCGVVDLASKKAYAIVKVPLGQLKFGAGRVISKHAIERCGGELWPPNLNRGLDTASHQKLRAHLIVPEIVQTEGIPITDVKTPENIWPYSTWENGSLSITPDEALHMLSPEHLAELKAI